MKLKNIKLHQAAIRTIDLLLACCLIIILLPIWFTNLLRASFKHRPLVEYFIVRDLLDRSVVNSRFTCGIFTSSASLIQIVRGAMSFVGLPFQSKTYHSNFSDLQKIHFQDLKLGLFNLADLYHWVGRIDTQSVDVIHKQIKFSRIPFGYLLLIFILSMAQLVYGRRALISPKTFSIFGLTINNDTLDAAIGWIESPSYTCRLGFFINVNSINLAKNNPVFQHDLKLADRCFADGSGMRLAAAHIGVHLSANLNGTDLLPHICLAHIKSHKSIFLLGAEDGIAESAAKSLSVQFPDLKIAGHYHGYFDKNHSDEIINLINSSGADTLLVAFGSPIQERWLIHNKHRLACATALAVGGLFDFVSGKISRAPDWLRAIGMEWIWRLANEPVKKFNRYVIGNPIFIFNTLILNKVGEPS